VWSKAAVQGKPPAPRAGHRVVEGLSTMYVVGGRVDAFGHVANDVCAIDTSSVAPTPPGMEDGGADDRSSAYGRTATPMTDTY